MASWYEYVINPAIQTGLAIETAFGPDQTPQQAASDEAANFQAKKDTKKANEMENAKQILNALFLALPKAALESTTCLADKVGWVKMAAVFAASYGSGNWGPWIDLVKPHTCGCGLAPYVNQIGKTGATAGLRAAVESAIESGCQALGQTLAPNKCACKDADMAPIMVLPHVQADPKVCGMTCDEIRKNLGIAIGTDPSTMVLAAQPAQSATGPQLLVLAGLVYLAARKGG
jgi:hypothetical protein